MKIGSLFSGYGGLDAGVQMVLGGTVAWHCDNDPGASKILAHHWPDTPNLGDITAVDWSQVEPVDVITGGSPCQDVSHAGKRAGMRAGTRSGLWASMCDAIDIIRPSLVVWENVGGVLSACADSELGQCPRCVGGAGDHRPFLRALGRVLGDLAEIGYDAQWQGIRAADVGAPHGRFRVFVVASDANDERPGVSLRRVGDSAERERIYGRDLSGAVSGTAPHSDRSTSDQRWLAAQAESGRARTDSRGRGGAPATDASGERHGRGQDAGSLGRLDDSDAGEARERQRAREVVGDRGAEAAADAEGYEQRESAVPGSVWDESWHGVERVDAVTDAERFGRDGWSPDALGEAFERVATARSGEVAWGQYEPAIRRWERLTRPAPAPTEPGSKGQPRLSPRFVEWLMGLPAGHVTDVPSISRNDQLKALGNGVVPQQAAAALRIMLATDVAA